MTAARDAPAGSSSARASASSARRRPVAARLLVVVFFFNLLYMPIEVALPLYVRGDLYAGAAGLGLLWAALGAGAAIGAALTNQLRNLLRELAFPVVHSWWSLHCAGGLIGSVTDLTNSLRRSGQGIDERVREFRELRPQIGTVEYPGQECASVGRS